MYSRTSWRLHVHVIVWPTARKWLALRRKPGVPPETSACDAAPIAWRSAPRVRQWPWWRQWAVRGRRRSQRRDEGGGLSAGEGEGETCDDSDGVNGSKSTLNQVKSQVITSSQVMTSQTAYRQLTAG